MKRGEAGLSLVIGVDKPKDLTSHDVVGRCRRIFNERRVGHAGTLDPMATGVLPILVGSATRLNRYMSGHDKRYEAVVAFGSATDTDDAKGKVIRQSAVPREVLDSGFAMSVLERFTGCIKQIPPIYSALKRNGKKACDEARRGNVVQLDPRDIEVYEARLLDILETDGVVAWRLMFHVSKGTYIRSLARDIGNACGSAAHLQALRRTSAGLLQIDDCVTLETLERIGLGASIDPVQALGFPIVFVDEANEKRIRNGMSFPLNDQIFYEYPAVSWKEHACSCTSGLVECCDAPIDGCAISVVRANMLLAIYRVDVSNCLLRAECVFQNGVSRGRGI
ncbi:tRNA pseudouridine(55) synthase TruB [Adlercreutzia sp. ZJ304]|uniref:tRNA pseudouridine(55) synthase TruB n=1 Tax=Adlercreutzia sp. ZJ304 TaxID=2709791 RepID=UPI0013EA0ABE|nr:tRNA pseudouridine(55) synthase TruB [Adlercreutzia sp. ZJ304]